MRTVENAEAWFWTTRVLKTATCWHWSGAQNSDGYGKFNWDGEQYAHRVAWRLVHGAIPDGLHVLHHCDVPSCVRPEHLHLGTHAQNMREAAERKRMRPVQKTWTHCRRGHLFDSGNTAVNPKTGWRRCRRCDAEAAARRRAENPEHSREIDRRYKAKKKRVA